MTEVIRHKSAGEKGRLYSRRARHGAYADGPVTSEHSESSDPKSEVTKTPSNPAPHPGLLEHLGPAYLASPDGKILWHNDTFVYFARAVWDVSPNTRRLQMVPPALQQVIDTLVATGHFEPGRIQTDAGGIERVFRGRHFLRRKSVPVSQTQSDVERITSVSLSSRAVSRRSAEIRWVMSSK